MVIALMCAGRPATDSAMRNLRVLPTAESQHSGACDMLWRSPVDRQDTKRMLV